jgi:mRNA interferase MazF
LPSARDTASTTKSVISCDNIITVRRTAVGGTIGLFFDDQEPALAAAISDAFDLFLS